MRTLFLVLIFLWGGVFLCCQSQDNPNLREIHLKVGFHCERGKALIENELSQKEGIKFVKADVTTKIVTIVYDSTKVNTPQIVEHFHKIGYLTDRSPAETKIKKACSHGHDEGDHH
ncbi:MAG: heavy-metal-associated domain-containing protein [Bacteroidales bacterium]|nr:heavy-metal-associated domain-containing protein [Bacteroidales bacterium]